jgi:hypothetical protein
MLQRLRSVVRLHRAHSLARCSCSLGAPRALGAGLRLAALVALLSLYCAGAQAQQRQPRFSEPGTQVRPEAPPRVGDCIGGSCRNPQLPGAVGPPSAPPLDSLERAPNRRARFGFAGAALGVGSATLLLGGSIAMAIVDDRATDRIGRGLWLGELALATPLVALSAFVARRGSGFNGYRGLRRLGWSAYGAAVTDGILLWYSALHDIEVPAALTITAGALSLFALLPHALDALTSARNAKGADVRVLALSPRGLVLTF